MSNNIKIVVAVLVGAVVGLGVSAVIPRESALGGVYNQVSNTFREGIKVGTSDQFIVSSTGSVTTSGSVSMGAATVSSVSSTGAGKFGTSTTQTSDFAIDGTGTSTLALFTTGTATCIQMINDDKVRVRATINGTAWVLALGDCK